MQRDVVVIPVYNHDRQIERLVRSIIGFGLPVILVDDGSSNPCASTLARITNENVSHVTLVVHEANRGKGAAVLTGLGVAHSAGFSHAVQIDADGQHNVNDVPALIAFSRARPDAMVTGQPQFDDSMPRIRRYSRYLTHVMVSVNTLTMQLRDAMCGFRVYPIARVLDIARRIDFGQRMDFDIEVLVRLDWAGVPIVLLPTRVQYPKGGVSHFQLVRDNARITSMHTRLFFGMLIRSPRLIVRALVPQAPTA